ncbi:hypothetical protein [Candidatus Phyllobacterium onerii]|uniref:hypothetical protein n=1 Tax=Candidatus Phyllobacterium onerii TaxID=3020828 RepID=UPI0023309EF4|nr:hypothetical protein [Phyllobacterium sp. IY22]
MTLKASPEITEYISYCQERSALQAMTDQKSRACLSEIVLSYLHYPYDDARNFTRQAVPGQLRRRGQT